MLKLKMFKNILCGAYRLGSPERTAHLPNRAARKTELPFKEIFAVNT